MDHITAKHNIEGREGEMGKWASSVVKTLKSECESVWKISSDFLGLKKYATFVEVCDHVEGEANSVGCVRLAESGDKSSKEKLVAIDPLNYCYSYTMGENSMGWVGYVASVKLQAVWDGTVVEWRFEVDPCPGYSPEEWIGMMSSGFERCIQGIELEASSLE